MLACYKTVSQTIFYYVCLKKEDFVKKTRDFEAFLNQTRNHFQETRLFYWEERNPNCRGYYLYSIWCSTDCFHLLLTHSAILLMNVALLQCS